MRYQDGPLSKARREKPKDPEPKKRQPKKPHKYLRLFIGFDEREYHPTIEFVLIGGVLHQGWRHRWTDQREWRRVPSVPTERAANELPQ